MANKRQRGVRWLRLLLLCLFTGLTLTLGMVAVAYARTDIPLPNAASTGQVAILTYADGSELARVGSENRRLVRLDQVSEAAQEAVLAAEDRGFYTEPGISPKGILRALFTNVRAGGVEAGGSSITQQYAKNALLTTDRTFSRKSREVLIAIKMTRSRSKSEILEDYLNTIYFGRRASGIEVAATTYFGKPAAKLTVAEAAVLASSIRSPAGYDPAKHPERARARWNYVLDGMVTQGWLSARERSRAVYPAAALKPREQGRGELARSAGHVVSAVLDELADERGITEAELSQGGYTVRTTIRREAQLAAAAAVEDVVKDAQRSRKGQKLQGALVAVKPDTGEVFAYYGGADGAGFDYAGQGAGRQPGSSFKPYVLATALEQEIGLRARYDGNSPKEFDVLDKPVANFDDRSYGRVSLREATEKSINTAYVELGLEVGPDKVADLAHRAGIPDAVPLKDVRSGQTTAGIALGIYDVHVIDQAVGFATFANGGVRVTPFMVKDIKDSGGEIYTAQSERSRAFTPEVAADATAAMQQVVESGTGRGARLPGRPAAGKTGTSSDNVDAWFVGFTPQLSAAVWLGYPAPETIRLDGVAVTGGFSSRIWQSFMQRALEGQEVRGFPPPADIGAPQEEPPPPVVEQPPRPTPEPRPEPEPEPEPVATESPTAPAREPVVSSPSITAPPPPVIPSPVVTAPPSATAPLPPAPPPPTPPRSAPVRTAPPPAPPLDIPADPSQPPVAST